MPSTVVSPARAAPAQLVGYDELETAWNALCIDLHCSQEVRLPGIALLQQLYRSADGLGSNTTQVRLGQAGWYSSQ
jgi:hypothetical protein